MLQICHFDNLSSKQWAMPKQKLRWVVFLKADCTKELSPEIYVSVKEGGTPNSLLATSLSAGLSLSLSLRWSLSLFQIRLAFTEMLLYVYAFQTQYIQRLFVRNNIDTSLLICTLYSIFGRKFYVSPVILVLSVLW